MSTLKILVIDDEVEICDLISFHLTRKGHDVKTLTSGTQALETLKSEDFDLVISDVRMPEGNGIEILAEIRKEKPKKPIFIISSGFADSTEQEALDNGAFRFLPKPLEYNMLDVYVQEAAEELKKH